MGCINLSIHQLVAFADGETFDCGKCVAKSKKYELPLEGPNGESCDRRSGDWSRNAPACLGLGTLIVSTYRFVFRPLAFVTKYRGFNGAIFFVVQGIKQEVFWYSPFGRHPHQIGGPQLQDRYL